MSPQIEQHEDGFRVNIYRFDGDHQAIVKEQVGKAEACTNGYKVVSTKKFIFGCPIFGIFPADCTGTSYIGRCKKPDESATDTSTAGPVQSSD